MQVRSQLLSIEFALEHLTEHWLDHDEAVFRKLIALAQQGIFKGSLDVITVTDADGQLQFSSHTDSNQSLIQQALVNRACVQQVLQEKTSGFFISPIAHNAITQRWTVQFNHSIFMDGEFSGLIIASVSAEHLAEAFNKVYPLHDDVVLLASNSGHLLTRSRGIADITGNKVPSEHLFLAQPEQNSGNYIATSAIDQVERIYAWHRVPDFPLVLSLGLGKQQVLSSALLDNQKSALWSLLASALFILSGLWITRLIILRAQQNKSLLQAHLRINKLLKQIPSGVLFLDEKDSVVMANEQLCTLLNLDIPSEQLAGLHHQDFLKLLKPEQADWFSLPAKPLIKTQQHEVTDSLGSTFLINLVPIQRNQHSLGHVWLIQDDSLRKQKEHELFTLATTDPLTGLHNRRSFLDCLEEHVKLSKPTKPGALLLLDIDFFKNVNDTYGHPVGDLVIKNVAQALRDSVRHDDLSGRIGGEEFAVLLPYATQPQALQLAERIRQYIEVTPTITGTHSIYITVSIGIVLLYGHDAKSAQIRADRALYQAKSSGRNRVCFNEPSK